MATYGITVYSTWCGCDTLVPGNSSSVIQQEQIKLQPTKFYCKLDVSMAEIGTRLKCFGYTVVFRTLQFKSQAYSISGVSNVTGRV